MTSHFQHIVLGGLCALAGAVQAAGPTGPIGPTTTTVIDNPGSGTNRIEVTGNTARNIVVQCGDGAAGSGSSGSPAVNSVHVDGRALQGRTVIITGRNAQDIDARVDCGAQSSAGAGASRGAANVNSVNIR